jgi:pimeloyl-ACP methyl ester carboxylesterase
LWSNNFAHIDHIYRAWAPSYEPPAELIDDVKATFRGPGATASTLGYYWAALGADSAETEAAAATSISMPVLIFSGTGDGPMESGRFEKARAAFAGPYTLVELGGVGHFPQLEAPEQTAEAIVNFLGPPVQPVP